MDNFIFEVVVKCIREELDKNEIYYIQLYNSFHNGYNSTIGGAGVKGMKGMKGENNPMFEYEFSEEQRLHKSNITSGKNNRRYDNTIYHFYDETFGDFFGTRYEFYTKFLLSNGGVGQLILGKIKHISTWVLGKNKDKYKEILKIYDFYNPKYGEVSMTCNHLAIEYKLNIGNIHSLTTGKLNYSQGWVMLSNEEIYDTLVINKNLKYRFYNEKLILYEELTQASFRAKYNFAKSSITNLCSGKIKSYKGWCIKK